MAEKEQYPTTNGYTRSDDTEAAAAHDATQLRKKKRIKCFIYVILFVIFQTAIITLFALTIMKLRTPKFRIHQATLTDFTTGTPASPSLTATMNAVLSVKNTNFGRYKYRNTTVVFSYNGTRVGEASVPNSKAGWRSTRKFNVAVNLRIMNNNGQFSSDLNGGVVRITSQAKMRGRVELLFVMKKNKATDMNCSMDILMAAQQIKNIVCK